jgi:Putative beta-barrel porin-2, OmpL-like. bbp2
MTRKLRYTVAGLFLSPVFALAQAPIVALDAPAKPAAISGQTPPTPAPMPMPTTTLPAVKSAPAATPTLTPAPAVPAPAIAMPEPAKGCDTCPPAEEEAPAPKDKFLLEKLLSNCCAAKTLGERGWTIYGWTQGSYNASSASRSNLPVPFIDRANQFSLMQNWLHVEKAIDTSKSEYQWGMAADLILPGTDSRFTISRGLWDEQIRRGDLYPIDLFQAYVDLFSPNVGPKGSTFRLGKFATHCEYEVVQGINNPFLSRSYNFQYNPFTHTGLNVITPLNDDWTVANGAVLGNDNFIDPTARLTYIGQVKWAPKDGKSSVMFNVSVTNPRFNEAENFAYYNAYNLQFTHKLTDKATYVLDTTYSHMDKIPNVGSADWYGFANYLLYQATDKLAWNNRVEMFNDSKGVRTGTEGLYTAVTTGLTWKPMPWLYIMPEVRYDYAVGRPFEGDHDLFTAAIGAIVRW